MTDSKKINNNNPNESGAYIGRYRLTVPLSGQNSGYARWGFAEYDGTEYFIKEFISPVYPDDNSPISREVRDAAIADCVSFEAKKSRLYRAVNAFSSGNIIGVLDFFRFGCRYYIVTEKVEIDPNGASYTRDLPFDRQLVLLKALIYNIKCVHDAGIVHADLKPDNLIIKPTRNGYFTAKLIDFDSSFFENDPPESPDEYQSDMVYLSPETFLRISGEDVRVTRSADIFAMGIIFHELICGHRPALPGGCDYLYEASLDGAVITPDRGMPPAMRRLIADMTAGEPEKRPRAAGVFERLTAMTSAPQTKTYSGFDRPTDLD
ncbi:MAG: protein kinase [Eubacteriales bacterium]|jgi:serine/threonine protein kinase|nr:protein kinase [Eubacteriales bacterium]